MISKSVYVVDDAQAARDIISMALKKTCHVKSFPSAEAAIEAMSSAPPDLVLLDLMMPEKSGISLISDMKRDEDLKKIPVIMVTGVSGETGIDLKSFLKRGSDKGGGTLPLTPEGYIEKPIDPAKLITLIKEFL